MATYIFKPMRTRRGPLPETTLYTHNLNKISIRTTINYNHTFRHNLFKYHLILINQFRQHNFNTRRQRGKDTARIDIHQYIFY